MSNNEKTKQNALSAFIGHKARVDEILTRLQKASEDHFDTNPNTINWGDTGFLSDIANNLQLINDRIFNEGEYSSENKA